MKVRGEAVAVGADEALPALDHVADVRDLADRTRGQQAVQEAHLVDVLVAEAGEVALVVQGEEHRALGVGGHPAHGFVERPVGAEEVGAEPGHRVVLGRAVEHLDQAEGEPDRLVVGVLQHDPGGVRGASPPAVGRIDVPDAFHLQMGVQRDVAGPDEQVLAPADRVVDGDAPQVERRPLRDAEVGTGEGPAGECIVQAARGAPDGVTFGHRAGGPSDAGRTRPRAAPRRGRWNRSTFRRPSRR